LDIAAREPLARDNCVKTRGISRGGLSNGPVGACVRRLAPRLNAAHWRPRSPSKPCAQCRDRQPFEYAATWRSDAQRDSAPPCGDCVGCAAAALFQRVHGWALGILVLCVDGTPATAGKALSCDDARRLGGPALERCGRGFLETGVPRTRGDAAITGDPESVSA